MIQIPFLNANRDWFPNPETALPDPDGLLAGGGDLSTHRLLNAYRRGIFPWYQDGQPILWWSPSVRAVLHPENLRISRSLRKTLRNKPFKITCDTVFDQVIKSCAAPRTYSQGTWITDEMQKAYLQLHQAGYAHSIETWHDGKLVGGLYGIAIGGCYFGESMFSCMNDASKVAFVCLIRHLQARQFRLIDCQMMTPHLESLGATPLERPFYLLALKECLQTTEYDFAFRPGHWHLDPVLLQHLDGPTSATPLAFPRELNNN